MARRKKPLTEAHAMAPIVGANIRRERVLRGLTQQQLAEQIGVHPARISEFERGLHEPRIGRLHEIAAALNVTVNQLIMRQRHKNR